MNATVEFQPAGLRIIVDEPTILLDIVRQAGISLRADCGGKGICGKCIVQLLSGLDEYPPTSAELAKLDLKMVSDGFRLACETIVHHDLKVFIPQESIIDGQILQIEGKQGKIFSDPLINQIMVFLDEPNLTDLQPDLSRIRNSLNKGVLTANLDILRLIPGFLRRKQWQANLILRKNRIIHITEKPLEKLIGLAVDVGSTKLACYLVDLRSGEIIAARGAPNPQIAYGEDIMARLAYALENPEHALKLQSLVFDTINQTAKLLCGQVGIDPIMITDACLVGNTAMHHLFLRLPVGALAVSPFVPVMNESTYPEAEELGLAAMPGSSIYAPPVIAGFVGSDHLAFLLAENFDKEEDIRLGIDIGTNTEIALKKGSRIVSVSTASGPAFEGAQIRFGMRAAPGAIEHVTLNADGGADIHIIGNRQPSGICGSGILDAVAEMRRVGMLNSRGRFNKQFSGVLLDENNKPYFILGDGSHPITISQKDVDQILLAKGAIRAGIDVLIDYLKVKPEEIDEIVIAGAFGSFMIPEQAMQIGMLPIVPLDRMHAVGNAAGAGARMMLISHSTRDRAEALAKRIEYLELTVYPDFPMFYARGIQA